MAGRERDWMDYAQLGSSLAQNAQLSSIGDQLAALKQAESQKQFAEFEVTVIRQILFRIEDRIRFFTKQPSFSPQGRMLALMKLAEVLAAFNEPSFYRNYEDKDRHTALNAKVDEAVMEIARSLPPADLAEFNEAVAWQRTKLPLLVQALLLHDAMMAYLKQEEERPALEAEYAKQNSDWLATKDAAKAELTALESELQQIKVKIKRATEPMVDGGVVVLVAVVIPFLGIPWLFSRRQTKRDIRALPELRKRAEEIKAQIGRILPPKPKKLPKLLPKPENQAATQFLLEENLGSTFQELKVTFDEKRSLVERVLQADANLNDDLSELDARALLHRTAQEVATKMGLPLPPQLASGASA